MRPTEADLIRTRLVVVSAALAIAALAAGARTAGAAAEVHRLNFVFSAIPTQIKGGDANDLIDFANNTLEALGLKGLDPIRQGWMYEAQLRYMLTPRISVNAGVGQLKKSTEQEYLPAIQQDVNLRWEFFSVPVHVGGAYYMAPYNQGDFQARAYLGGGFYSLVQNRVKFQQTASGVPGVTSVTTAWKRDSPGYYVEGGVHMFFASRFSVMLGVMYRSAKVEALLERSTHEPAINPDDGEPTALDMSGVGGRMGFCFGF